MTRVPRASFCITILDDEDYRVLMTSRGGVEAFGVFVSMVLVGRERLQQGKARQMSDSAALRFDNSTAHVIEMAHVTTKQMDNCLSMLAVAAKETGGEPWMHIDETRHLVIRSFFKFNANSSWGGARNGAGRPPSRNQDGSEVNQDESDLKPTRNLSVSSSVSVSKPPLPPNGGTRAGVPIDPEDSEPFIPPGSEPLPAPEPAVKNDPAEVERAVARTEEAFPMNGWGKFARLACKDYPAAWVSEAVQIGAENGASGWVFMRKVLERFKAQGSSDSEAKSRNGRPRNGRKPEPPAPEYETVRATPDQLKMYGYAPKPTPKD